MNWREGCFLILPGTNMSKEEEEGEPLAGNVYQLYIVRKITSATSRSSDDVKTVGNEEASFDVEDIRARARQLESDGNYKDAASYYCDIVNSIVEEDGEPVLECDLHLLASFGTDRHRQGGSAHAGLRPRHASIFSEMFQCTRRPHRREGHQKIDQGQSGRE